MSARGGARFPALLRGVTGSRYFPPILLALAALLPNLWAAVPRYTYYFRDFTLAFYPLRSLAGAEWRAGRWPGWVPYLQEGLPALPSLYPLDLLQIVWPGPVSLSWVLTLHVPLAAVAFYAFCREMKVGRGGAFVGGMVYGVSGFTLSCLNLYVLLQAAAVVPLILLGLRRVVTRGASWVAVSALAIGWGMTTLAVEFVAQGLLLGAALAFSEHRGLRSAGRLAASGGLGLGLAGLPIAMTIPILVESQRGQGFLAAVGLANAVHPVAFIETLVPGVFGSFAVMPDYWWGERFSTKGFPYFVSLYLGPLALALAVSGWSCLRGTRRWVFGCAGLLGLAYSLGDLGGLAPLAHSLGLRWFRFPSKALLLALVAVAFCAALGAERLAQGTGWRLVRRLGVGLGMAAFLLGLVAELFSEPAMRWAGVPKGLISHAANTVSAQALTTGIQAVAIAALAWAVVAGRVRSRVGMVVVVVGLVVDLTRVGAMLNPQIPARLLEGLPEVSRWMEDKAPSERVFSYGVEQSPAFARFTGTLTRHRGLWTFLVYRRILGPYTNVLDSVETAAGKDLTSFGPLGEDATAAELRPDNVDELLVRLDTGAVGRILSLDRLSHPRLQHLGSVDVAPGLPLHLYGVRAAWPRAYVACHVTRAAGAEDGLRQSLGRTFDPARDVALEGAFEGASCSQGRARHEREGTGRIVLHVEADGPGYAVTRDRHARGWTATVDGLPASILRANGKHMAIPVPGGRHAVSLVYRPPGFEAGLVVSALALLLVTGMLVWAWVARRRSPRLP